jgi:hypothetical protein
MELKKGDRLFLPLGKKVTLQANPIDSGRFIHVTTDWGKTRLDRNAYYDVERDA